MDGRVQVGVVAADPLRSVGLLAILNDTPGVCAVAMEMDAAQVNEENIALLLDTRWALDEMVETIVRLRRERPSLKIVLVGVPLGAEDVQVVIGAGAKGYLTETAGESEIRMAIEVVLDGSIWAPRKVLARLIDAGGVMASSAKTTSESIEALMTPRELDVLQLLMDGRTNRDIASEMGIDEATVKAHLGRMLRKTRSTNRVELTLRAMDDRVARVASPGSE